MEPVKPAPARLLSDTGAIICSVLTRLPAPQSARHSAWSAHPMATQGIARHTPAPCASLAWCGHAQHRRDVAKVERDVVLVDVVDNFHSRSCLDRLPCAPGHRRAPACTVKPIIRGSEAKSGLRAAKGLEGTTEANHVQEGLTRVLQLTDECMLPVHLQRRKVCHGAPIVQHNVPCGPCNSGHILHLQQWRGRCCRAGHGRGAWVLWPDVLRRAVGAAAGRH